MSPEEAQVEICKHVCDHFVRLRSPVDRKSLVVKFEHPEVLHEMVNTTLLRESAPGQVYFPRLGAFAVAGDVDLLNYVKAGIAIALATAKRLFFSEDDASFTWEHFLSEARKGHEALDEDALRLGLLFLTDLRVLQGYRMNDEGTAITNFSVGEWIVKVRSPKDWLEQELARYGPKTKAQGTLYAEESNAQAVLGMEGTSGEVLGGGVELVRAASGTRAAQPSEGGRPMVVISHSSHDEALALAAIELLRAGLGLLPQQIRCSSVDGYRLPAGVNTDAQLRQEVTASRSLIGLITPNSLESPYVLFELGARWGAGFHMVPLLAGVSPGALRGPLTGINALSCSSEAQLHQLLEDLGRVLNLPLQSAASYSRYVAALKVASDAIPAKNAGGSEPAMQFEESVYWKCSNGRREGPFGPVCYDDKGKAIHLAPGTDKGAFHCGVCKASFRTSEYSPPRRQVPGSSHGPWS